MGKLVQRGPCVNCGNPFGSYPRRLCKACYLDMDIRVKYPRIGDQVGNKMVLDYCGNREALIQGVVGTEALPGSESKVAVMEERARQGLPVCFPQDCVFNLD